MALTPGSRGNGKEGNIHKLIADLNIEIQSAHMVFSINVRI